MALFQQHISLCGYTFITTELFTISFVNIGTNVTIDIDMDDNQPIITIPHDVLEKSDKQYVIHHEGEHVTRYIYFLLSYKKVSKTPITIHHNKNLTKSFAISPTLFVSSRFDW